MKMKWAAWVLILASFAYSAMAFGEVLGDKSFVTADIDKGDLVYTCSGHLVEIVQINNDLYLACFKEDTAANGPHDYSFVLYNASSNRVSNSISIKSSRSYKIKEIDGQNMFLLVYGDEIANSSLVSYENNSLSVLKTYWNAELVVAGENLIGMAYYEPMYSGKVISGSDMKYGILPEPGSFSGCELNKDNRPAGVYYLNNDLAVLFVDNPDEKVAFCIGADCSTSWSTNLPQFSYLRGTGNLGSELIGIVNSPQGALGLSFISGSLVRLGVGGELILQYTFYQNKLVYPSVSEFSPTNIGVGYQLRCIGPGANDIELVPLLNNNRPSIINSANDRLHCYYGSTDDTPVEQTVVYSEDLSTATTLNGTWVIVGSDASTPIVFGGSKISGDLYIGSFLP